MLRATTPLLSKEVNKCFTRNVIFCFCPIIWRMNEVKIECAFNYVAVTINNCLFFSFFFKHSALTPPAKTVSSGMQACAERTLCHAWRIKIFPPKKQKKRSVSESLTSHWKFSGAYQCVLRMLFIRNCPQKHAFIHKNTYKNAISIFGNYIFFWKGTKCVIWYNTFQTLVHAERI